MFSLTPGRRCGGWCRCRYRPRSSWLFPRCRARQVWCSRTAQWRRIWRIRSRSDRRALSIRLDDIALAGENESLLQIRHQQQGVEVAQNPVGPPLLGEFHGAARQLAVVLFEFRLEAGKQAEGVGSRSGKACDDLVLEKPSQFVGGALQHLAAPGSPGRRLPSRLAVPSNNQDRCPVNAFAHEVDTSSLPRMATADPADIQAIDRIGQSRFGKEPDRRSRLVSLRQPRLSSRSSRTRGGWGSLALHACPECQRAGTRGRRRPWRGL